MLHKLFLLSCLIPSIVVGMNMWPSKELDELITSEPQQAAGWITPTIVHVYYSALQSGNVLMDDTQRFSFPLASNTHRETIMTIDDLKQFIEDSTEILEHRQTLYPYIITPYLFGLLSTTKVIDYDLYGNMEEIMGEYKTNSFLLRVRAN